MTAGVVWVLAEALAQHVAGEAFRARSRETGERATVVRCTCGSVVPDFAAHVASVVAALPNIEITKPGTSDAMRAFAHGSISKQRVLEDIAYVLTGWRYEEPEDIWEAVAAIAKDRGNGALVAEVEKSYAAAARAAGGQA